ncbi:MAG: hypothetical protein KAI79_13615 [Bacteroidales bacterium]|nr:hypothetical protein [Bacteroidales bacterium]
MMYPIQQLFPDLQGTKEEILQNIKNIEISKPILFVAMTARTGSTAFCSLLKKDERIGLCDELFNPRGPIPSKLKNIGKESLTFAQYIEHRDKEVSRMYFTFKINWIDYQFFVENKLDKILFKNATFIFLDRLDIEEQSVSLYYSKETKIWHSTHENLEEDEKPVAFNKKALDKVTLNLMKEKKEWWNYFYTRQINPLVLYYENFTLDFDPAYSQILKSINVAKEIAINWEDTAFQKFSSKPKSLLIKALKSQRYEDIIK